MKATILKSLAPFACSAALCMAPFANLHASDPYTVFLDGRNTPPGVNTLFWDITAGPAGQIHAVSQNADWSADLEGTTLRHRRA